MHDHHEYNPQHPLVKEPIFLKIDLDDDNIIQEAEIDYGFIHRGMEKVIEGKTVESALHAIEHICGVCSYAHSGAFTTTLERAQGIEVPEIVQRQRTIIGELEKIHSHLLWMGIALHEMNERKLFRTFWGERENVLVLFDELTGNRVHHAANMVGTMKKNFYNDVGLIKNKTNLVKRALEKHKEETLSNNILLSHYEGFAKIEKKYAITNSLVGNPARATGINFDVRKNDPYDFYPEIDFEVKTDTSGDALARFRTHYDECLESCGIIEQAVHKFPKEELPKNHFPKIEDMEMRGRVEAPRGENFHYMEVQDRKIKKYKIRPPTLSNIHVYCDLMLGLEMKDVPLVITSMDPCFSCMERVMVTKGNEMTEMDENEFKERYCEHHD